MGIWIVRKIDSQGLQAAYSRHPTMIAALLETFHLLRSPANARRLLAALRDANAGKLVELPLIDPDDRNAQLSNRIAPE
jgi:hypothetical protein